MEKEDKRNMIKQELISTIVMTTYGKPTFYRVLDIEFKKLEDVYVNQECQNLIIYYQKKYNIKVKPIQPLLTVENKIRRREKAGSTQGPTYLLPQLCSMTGIPDNFDENRRKKVSQQTILDPKTKKNEIDNLIKKMD